MLLHISSEAPGCKYHTTSDHISIKKGMQSDSSVQSLSHVRLFATPWTAARQASLSINNSRACSNSCPSSQWCHPTISSSVVPFSSCLQSFPASHFLFCSAFWIYNLWKMEGVKVFRSTMAYYIFWQELTKPKTLFDCSFPHRKRYIGFPWWLRP